MNFGRLIKGQDHLSVICVFLCLVHISIIIKNKKESRIFLFYLIIIIGQSYYNKKNRNDMVVFHFNTFNEQPNKYTTLQLDHINNYAKNHEIIAR